MQQAPKPVLDRLKAHCEELDRRAKTIERNERYFDNEHPLAEATRQKANEQNGVFSLLADLARENYAAAPINASLERLEQIGFRWGDKATAAAAWEIYQRNYMDSEGRLTIQTALIHGRAFEIVWDETGDGKADITVESPLNVVVEYEPGSRHRRRAATRRWRDDGVWYATLFLKDRLWKFKQPARYKADNPPEEWEPWEIPGEPWPLTNPLGVVPVVEHPVNRVLRTRQASQTRFGVAAGEFDAHIGLLDRIHYTTFCGLAGISWAGFQTLALFGVPHKRKVDQDGNETNELIPPFEYAPGAVIQIEQAKDAADIRRIEAADAKGFLEHTAAYVASYASLTRTPLYKVHSTQIVNIGAEGMRMLDDGYIAKLGGYATTLGEAREETMRLAFAVEGNDEAARFAAAETIWRDPEITTLAAQADAASKLMASDVPFEYVGERIFKMSPGEIEDIMTAVAANALTAAATNPDQQP